MKSLWTVVFLTILAGCATVKVPQPINGSRADGTITLAYQMGAFEKPVVDWNLARDTAKIRCIAWGYRNAEAFGGTQTHCTFYDGNGNCMSEQVNVIYQCTK